MVKLKNKKMIEVEKSIEFHTTRIKFHLKELNLYENEYDKLKIMLKRIEKLKSKNSIMKRIMRKIALVFIGKDGFNVT